ncbi:MAG: hypothetical protein ABIO04_04040 [Ferruginibacter sp.]
MNFTVADLVGTIGVTLLLSAFLLNLLNKISQANFIYIFLNLVGASLACLASVILKYIPFVILEGTWTLVSLVALVNYFIKNSK